MSLKIVVALCSCFTIGLDVVVVAAVLMLLILTDNKPHLQLLSAQCLCHCIIIGSDAGLFCRINFYFIIFLTEIFLGFLYLLENELYGLQNLFP